IEELLVAQENRWWSVKLQSLGSKEHFLRYGGRYATRPPIAQRRITYISQKIIKFCAKDKKSGRFVMIELTPKKFISAWMQHIPDRYEHAIRAFGLFSPRTLGATPNYLLVIPNQHPRRPRPKPLPWNISIKRDFGWDPLLDQQGNKMKWTRRIASSPNN
ncbi:MAG TPA: transposase, partial [Terriglobales bacterium]